MCIRDRYAIYSDVNEQIRLEQDLKQANEKMQDIINAIPGGVAIYRVSDMFETVYFSDGVPELSGYTVEEYRELIKQDAATMIYREDTAMVVSKAREVILSRGVSMRYILECLQRRISFRTLPMRWLTAYT